MNLFLFNIVLQLRVGSPELSERRILIAGVLGAISIFPGIVGILIREWRLKLLSWFVVMLVVIENLSILVLRGYGVVYWGPVPFFAESLVCLVSYAMLRYVVIHAYLTRLSFVVDGTALSKYRRELMHIWKVYVVFVPLFIILHP